LLIGAVDRAGLRECVRLSRNNLPVTSLQLLRDEFDHEPGTFTVGLLEARWDRPMWLLAGTIHIGLDGRANS
jgi:hypothetical protein